MHDSSQTDSNSETVHGAGRTLLVGASVAVLLISILMWMHEQLLFTVQFMRLMRGGG